PLWCRLTTMSGRHRPNCGMSERGRRPNRRLRPDVQAAAEVMQRQNLRRRRSKWTCGAATSASITTQWNHTPPLPSGDHLTLYDKSQWVGNVRSEIAHVFGMPKEKIRVVSPFVGGAFGSALRQAWSG